MSDISDYNKYLKYKKKYIKIKGGSNRESLCQIYAAAYVNKLNEYLIYKYDHTSEKIVNRIKIDGPLINSYMSINKRVLNVKVDKIFESIFYTLGGNFETFINHIIDNSSKTKGGAFFYALNLQYSADNKHSMYLIFSYNEDLDNYTLELFDPNGPLNPNDLKEDMFEKEHINEYNCWKITELICKKILEETGLVIVPVEVLRDGYNLNLYDTGHCDALSLFYITIRKDYGFYESLDILKNYLPFGFKSNKIYDLNRKIITIAKSNNPNDDIDNFLLDLN